MEINLDRGQGQVRAWHLRDDVEAESFFGLNANAEHIGRERRARRRIEKNPRYRIELDRDLARALGQPLSGAQIKRYSGPAPILDKALERDESLELRVRRDVLLLPVSFRVLPADEPLGVLAAHYPSLDVFAGERAQGAQHIELGIAHRVGRGR